MTRPRFARAAALTVTASIVVLSVSGCGGPDGAGSSNASPGPIDTAEVESLLVATQRRASPGFNVGAASCPDRVTATEGATFNCTVLVEGVAAPYIVTFAAAAAAAAEDGDAGTRTGRYDLRPAKAILAVPKLVDLVKSLATDPTARVDCGPAKVRVADVGSTLDCRLTDGLGEHTVNLRVDDTEGKVTVLGAG